jgi:hypothetical protein
VKLQSEQSLLHLKSSINEPGLNSIFELYLSYNNFGDGNSPIRTFQLGDPKNTGNLMSMEEVHALLNERVPKERLCLHMKHDANWEKYPEIQ